MWCLLSTNRKCFKRPYNFIPPYSKRQVKWLFNIPLDKNCLKTYSVTCYLYTHSFLQPSAQASHLLDLLTKTEKLTPIYFSVLRDIPVTQGFFPVVAFSLSHSTSAKKLSHSLLRLARTENCLPSCFSFLPTFVHTMCQDSVLGAVRLLLTYFHIEN